MSWAVPPERAPGLVHRRGWGTASDGLDLVWRDSAAGRSRPWAHLGANDPADRIGPTPPAVPVAIRAGW